MIRLVSGVMKTSLFAGAALVLAGTVGVQAESSALPAASEASATVEAKKPAGGCGAAAAGCKTKCEKKAASEAGAAVEGKKPDGGCCAGKAEKPAGGACKSGCSVEAGKPAGGACAAKDGACKSGCSVEKAADPASQPAAAVKVQEKCPVMGGAINKNLYVDHDGKRVYVCCQGCIEPIKKDPAKYIKALEADGVTVEVVKPTEP